VNFRLNVVTFDKRNMLKSLDQNGARRAVFFEMRTVEGEMIGNQIRRGPEHDTTAPISALSRTVANNRIGQQYA
jgi:hypothetical protein